MMPTESRQVTGELDPVEYINSTLYDAWNTLASAYDVTACIPDLDRLFAGVELDQPGIAADTLICSMLLEIMECVGRFSPWYRRPARAFGLITLRNPKNRSIHYLLAPEASQQWSELIDRLEGLIRRYQGLIKALVLMEAMAGDLPNDPCVAAACGCIPPRRIHLRRSILEQAEITCEACHHVYS